MDSNADLIQDFVARSGTRFVVQARNGTHGLCETFYFAGANTYYLVSDIYSVVLLKKADIVTHNMICGRSRWTGMSVIMSKYHQQ